MSIDKDTVKHISKLARISLDEKKINSLSKDLSSIMEFIEKLSELTLKNDTNIIMFVKLKKRIKLNNNLSKKIINKLKQNLSPKHVPKEIIQVSDIPKTKSGKIVELAIKNIINGKKIENINSLANPECLNDFKNRNELKKLKK